MKRPKTTIRKIAPQDDPQYPSNIEYWNEYGCPVPKYVWACVSLGKIVDVYMTRKEAREFAHGFDPDGWFCEQCDETRVHSTAEVRREGKWRCELCGTWNNEPP